VSTREAYAGIVPQATNQNIRSIVEQTEPGTWKGTLNNQFERHIVELFPVIGVIKKELYHAGALYASMSGSGSAVYGIFRNEVSLRDQFSMHDFWSGWLKI
jgi:4-diphosphocytidyl-2-C-methyl-D-erythritol kinase